MSQGARTETEDEPSRTNAAAPQLVISELVPEGRALIPVQTAERTYLAVHPEAELKQLVQELNDHIQHSHAVGFTVTYNGAMETRDRPTV
ncbi:hypothetical protein ACFWA6_18215 [Streptomyces sp. NPDC060020]|uniref:hypothetical protein n=1 Tax=Streptomyces sp. NPDC060020 TaxID=3347038 RepID=UPI0036C28782